MADKCKDCKHYDKIDNEKGECVRYPPSFLKDNLDRYPIVAKTKRACGEFESEE